MCIFCSIIKKEIPSSCIYEDDIVMAFLDISQVTKGHTLIVPKKHVDSILECDDETLAHLIKVAKKLSNRLVERCQANGINVLTNVNEIAGQSVFHFHVHLIPRYNQHDACHIEFQESEQQDLQALQALLK